MPALVNIAVSLALGAGMALVARRSNAMAQSPMSWPLLLLLAFQAVLFTPIATYQFRFYPQWSMLYWFDPQIFPEVENWTGALSLLAIVLNFGAAVGGYLIARWGIVSKQAWMWSLPLVISTGTLGYCVLGFWERIVFIGEYDAFWQGEASLLVASVPGWLGIILYGAACGLLWWARMRFGERDPSFL